MKKKIISISGVILFPILLFFIFMTLSGGKLSFASVPLLLSQSMIPAMLGLSMAVLMQCGLMDFSVGCRVIFACAMGNWFADLMGLPGFILGVIIGAAVISLGVALCYRYLKIPSMVVSMGFVLLGEIAGYYVADIVGERGGMFYDAGIVAPFAYPWNILWVAVAGVFFYFVMYRTKLGAHIGAIGDDEVLASSLGVSPANTKTWAYMLSAVFVAIAAFIQVGSVGIVSLTLNMGTMNMVFQPMMGVIIGMTLLSLWNNFPVMVVMGELCITIIFNGLLSLGLSDSWQNVFLGLFMFAVLGISGNIPRVREWQRKIHVRKTGPDAYLPQGK